MKKNKKREPIDDLIDLWCWIRRRSQQESRADAASTIKAGKPGAPAPILGRAARSGRKEIRRRRVLARR